MFVAPQPVRAGPNVAKSDRSSTCSRPSSIHPRRTPTDRLRPGHALHAEVRYVDVCLRGVQCAMRHAIDMALPGARGPASATALPACGKVSRRPFPTLHAPRSAFRGGPVGGAEPNRTEPDPCTPAVARDGESTFWRHSCLLANSKPVSSGLAPDTIGRSSDADQTYGSPLPLR